MTAFAMGAIAASTARNIPNFRFIPVILSDQDEHRTPFIRVKTSRACCPNGLLVMSSAVETSLTASNC
jgi:hypothetical protein